MGVGSFTHTGNRREKRRTFEAKRDALIAMCFGLKR